MKKSLWVYVTEDDIAKGRPRNGNSCPIALAVKRKHGPATMVTVLSRRLIVDKHLYSIPEHAEKFVYKIDHGWGHRPIRFLAKIIK